MPLASIVQWSWISDNRGEIGHALVQHVELSVIAVVLGLAISVPLAVVAWRYRVARAPIVGFSGLLYTLPSIAIFGLLQPITGFFSATTAEVALTSYTLLILVRNIVSGLDAIPAEVRESARAVGYTQRTQILRVYLPLSLPALFAGLRVAAVTVIGLVTVTAFVGQGGLGQLVFTGFSETFATPIIVGLVLSVLLAAVADAALVLAERTVLRWDRAVAS
ncbi:MAG TPA: ABC transporter permease [Acidimicrobiales bacterium]|jgi:osmoprotectant transport system permease protein|nr:ABC transporter permease [Acidimicrobiales bacterium]